MEEKKLLEFGRHIRKARFKIGMTATELAKRAKVSRNYIHCIEYGKVSIPTEETISKIARILDVNEYNLLFIGGRIPKKIKDLILNNSFINSTLLQLADMNPWELQTTTLTLTSADCHNFPNKTPLVEA